MLQMGAIVSWSAKAAEAFKNSLMKDYVKGKMSLPGAWGFIRAFTFRSSPDYVRGAIGTAAVDRIENA